MEILDCLVYAICHPITDEVVYIGKTHNLKLRSYGHMARKNTPEIHQWISDLKELNLRPKFVPIVSNLSNKDAAHLEYLYIFRGFRNGGRLKNKQPLTKIFLSECQNNKGITLEELTRCLQEPVEKR
jgi:hypothetical protein